jgi:hypothetical protein
MTHFELKIRPLRAIHIVGQLHGLARQLNIDALHEWLKTSDEPFEYKEQCRHAIRFAKAMQPKARPEKSVRSCPYCGKAFTAKSHNQKFCDYHCRWDNAAELRHMKQQQKKERNHEPKANKK